MGMAGLGGHGKQGEGKAEQGVKAGLQEHAGQVDAAGGGGLGVGVGEPGVHRHHGYLDDEGQQQRRQTASPGAPGSAGFVVS